MKDIIKDIMLFDKQFVWKFEQRQIITHKIAKEKGWHDKPQDDGTFIALMHSELSEGLEWLRYGNPKSDHIPEFSGCEEELADVIIRIMDFAELKGFRVAEAIIAKSEYNKTRNHKHGGKEF